jgi:hypothetical protein
VPLLRCKSRGEIMKPGVTVAIVLVALGIAFWVFCGFYSVQPIGAAPEGMTAIVWRSEGEPFFNSADGLCLERVGGVSLICRAMALSQAPTDRIILRLPYQKWAYHASTGGSEFDR